jgi:nucleolar pre-ribosomal-associated protein 1
MSSLFYVEQLTHLFQESLGLSAFTSVLRVLAESTEDTPLEQVKALLQDVLVQNAVLSKKCSFDALLESLKGSNRNELTVQISFLDNCITRLVKRPLLYLDMVESLVNEKQNLSPIVATINEQWPFVVKMGNSEREIIISGWAARLFVFLGQLGEDKAALTSIGNNMLNVTKNSASHSSLKTPFNFTNEAINLRSNEHGITADDILLQNMSGNIDHAADLSGIFGTLPREDESHLGLHRWERDELDVALEQGYVGDLILCLCSEHEEIRRQAFAGISRFMIKLMVSAQLPKERLGSNLKQELGLHIRGSPIYLCSCW